MEVEAKMRKGERDNKTDKMIRRRGGGGFFKRDKAERKGCCMEEEKKMLSVEWGRARGGKDAWRKSCGYDRPPCEGWFGLSKIQVSSSIFSTS